MHRVPCRDRAWQGRPALRGPLQLSFAGYGLQLASRHLRCLLPLAQADATLFDSQNIWGR
jgi:hypothetical protein